ncbi:response regulator [Granulosicoccus sp. 3-233]|uniref:response regulator n=1 Tax=Granulosicoccus sp. 3-233 TaxID=3417969 RepID=UPI003D34FF8F
MSLNSMHSARAQVEQPPLADELLVLAIEDDSLDFTILERQLRGLDMFKLVWAQSMRKGLSELARHDFDVILLDLTLPDSQGLSTVEAFTEQTRLPVVVVSGLDDEETALKAVQHGAQDYLVKGQYSTALICKTLRYAVERYRLLEELEQTREVIQREREIRRLKSDAAQLPSALSTDAHSNKPLIDKHPAVHRYAVEEYSRMLDKAMERLGYKTTFNASQQIRELAITLGGYQATPRDIVNIHTLAVDIRSRVMNTEKQRLHNEEARYLLTGMLGHLCSFYLSQCKQIPATPPLAAADETTPASGHDQ